MVVVDIKQYVCIIVFPNQKPHQDRLKSSRRWDAATLSSYLVALPSWTPQLSIGRRSTIVSFCYPIVFRNFW